MTIPTHIPSLANRLHLPPPDNDYQNQHDYHINADALIKKLSAKLPEQTEGQLTKVFEEFKAKYYSQVVFKHSEAELAIFFADYVLYAMGEGYSISSYFDFEFYRKELQQRSTFISDHYMRNELLMLNDYGELSSCDNKELFGENYKEFVARDWIVSKHVGYPEFKDFIRKHSRFIVKMVNGSMGKGIYIEEADLADVERLYQNYKKKRIVMEEIISQHADVSAFNDSTLNTIRVVTFVDEGKKPCIVFCAGRFGRADNCIDNFHGGGMCVGIEPDTGRIYTDAIDGKHNIFSFHPDSGKVFAGFQYPCWEKLRAKVLEAAMVNPLLRWVGWDVAVTESGEIEFIEGNTMPGIDIVQGPSQTGQFSKVEQLVKKAATFDKAELAIHGSRIHYGVKFLSYSGTGKFWLEVFEAMEERQKDSASCLLLFNTLSKIDFPIAEGRDVLKVDLQSVYDRYSGAGIQALSPLPKAETVMVAMLLEYIKKLPEFIADVCAGASRQVLILCRPWDKDEDKTDRWRKRKFAADFTEKFLMEEFARHDFSAVFANKIIIQGQEMWLYDFRPDR